MFNNNKYMGKKIREVQRAKSNYNSEKYLKNYKRLKYLEDEMVKTSKFNKNVLLGLVTPCTFEKRIIKILKNNNRKNRLKAGKTFCKSTINFNTPLYKYDINNSAQKSVNITNIRDKIIHIEREGILTN